MPVITESLERTFANPKVSVQGLVTAESGASDSCLFVLTYQPKAYVAPHYHDDEQILYCLEGEGLVYFQDRPQPLEAGQVVVIPAGVRHAIFNTGQTQLRVAAFNPVAIPTTHWLTNNRRCAPRAPFARAVFEPPAAAEHKTTMHTAGPARSAPPHRHC